MFSLRTIARPYAKAILEISQEDQSFDRWSSLLQFYSIASKEKSIRFIFTGVLSTSETMKILSGLFEGFIDEKSYKLLNLMAENKNLLALTCLHDVYTELLNVLNNQANILVTSAFPLNTKDKEEISNLFKEKLNKKVNLVCKVNSDIIGGLLIKYNDLLIDSSVKNKLFRMKQELQF